MTDKDSLVQVSDITLSPADKLRVLNIQKFLSSIGIFASIVLTTNLFLINSKQGDRISAGFGIASIFVTLLNIVSLFWTLRQSKKVNSSGQDGPETTDNQFTRFVLFSTLVIYTTFVVLFIIYDFANDQIINRYTATHNQTDVDTFKEYIGGKKVLVDFLSLINIVIGLYSTFSAYELSSSSLTQRLLVYLICAIGLYLSYFQISAIRELQQIFFKAKFQYTEWPIQVTLAVSIAAIVILVLAQLVNHRKLRSAYMIIGALFITLIAVQIPATGQVFRDYNTLAGQYKGRCASELGKLDVNFVESNGCPNKYLYDVRSNCPTNLQLCFKNATTCSRSDNQFVWERSLINNPLTTTKLACINNQCCGILVNTYTSPLLKLGALGITFLFYIFYLAVFSFQLSSKDKGNSELHDSLRFFLWAIFLVLLIGGIIYVTWPFKDYLNRKGITTNFQEQPSVQTVSSSNQMQRYLPDSQCEKFSVFFQRAIVTLPGNKYNSVPVFKNAGVTGNTVVTDLGNLQQLASSDSNPINLQAAAGQTKDGYAIVFQTPPIKAGGCEAQFQYNQITDDLRNKVRVLSASELINLMSTTSPPSGADIASEYNYIGLVGQQQAIQQIISNNLQICNYDNNPVTAKCDLHNTPASAFFQIRVLDVHLADFGINTSEDSQTTQTLQVDRPKKLHKQIQHEHKSQEQKHNSNRKLALTNTLPTQAALIQPIKVLVHDLIDDSALEGARVTVYLLKAGTGQLTFGSETSPSYQENCRLDSNIQPNVDTALQPDFVGVTGKDGRIDALVYFSTTPATVSFAVYVDKEGYNINCRYLGQITPVTQDLLKSEQVIDIGISRQLEAGQTQVVLQWDRGQSNSATDLEAFDLDLWATFGQYSGDNQFSCLVGRTDDECGGVFYHGDAAVRKNGVSSEAITFKTLGDYDYLIFFNRFYQNLLDNDADRTSSKWVSDIATYSPVLKYYSSESRYPYESNTLSEILGGTYGTAPTFAKAGISATCATGPAIDQAKKVAFLSFAIRGTSSNGATPSEKALLFTTSATSKTTAVWTDLQSYPCAATSAAAFGFNDESNDNDVPTTQSQTTQSISVNGLPAANVPVSSQSVLRGQTAP